MGDILVKFMLQPVWPTAYHVKYLLHIVVPRYCDFLKLQFLIIYYCEPYGEAQIPENDTNQSK